MSGKTHVAVGVASSSAFVSIVMKQDITVVDYTSIMMFGTLGALFPDIDHAGSTLGHKFPLLAKMFKHRGFTHTIFCSIIMFLLFNFLILKIPFYQDNIELSNKIDFLGFNLISFISMYTIIFYVGYFSHLVADCLTSEGLRVFKLPFNIFDGRICVPLVTRPEVENIVYLGCMIITPFAVAGI